MKRFVLFAIIPILFSCGTAQQAFLDGVYYPQETGLEPLVNQKSPFVYSVNGTEFSSRKKANEYAKIEKKFIERDAKIESLENEVAALKNMMLTFNTKNEEKASYQVAKKESDEKVEAYETALYTPVSSTYSGSSSYRPKNVHVKGHIRHVNGKTVYVKSHYRSSPRRR